MATNWQKTQTWLPFVTPIIQELRRQFSGAIPLADQEKFSKAMLQLKTDKEHMQSEVKVVSKNCICMQVIDKKSTLFIGLLTMTIAS